MGGKGIKGIKGGLGKRRTPGTKAALLHPTGFALPDKIAIVAIVAMTAIVAIAAII